MSTSTREGVQSMTRGGRPVNDPGSHLQKVEEGEHPRTNKQKGGDNSH